MVRKNPRRTRELPRKRGRRLNSVRTRFRAQSPDECRGSTEESQLDDATLPLDSALVPTSVRRGGFWEVHPSLPKSPFQLRPRLGTLSSCQRRVIRARGQRMALIGGNSEGIGDSGELW